MSWKPCRGNNIGFDKNINAAHDNYFLFHQCSNENLMTKSKIAFKWVKAELYLRKSKTVQNLVGENFIKLCIDNQSLVYKPFLKLIL